MKIVGDVGELESLEGLSDTELAQLVRDAFKKFKAGRDNDIEGADPSTAAHGGASRRPPEDEETASQRAGTLRATEDVRVAQDRARRVLEAQLEQDERDAEAETIVKGYRRL